MLVARVAVQRPRVVMVDADAEGALDAIARMRELPDAEGIDVVFFGRPGAALAGAEDALAHEGSGFFARPVNVPALLKKIESLALGQDEAAPGRVRSETVRTQRSTRRCAVRAHRHARLLAADRPRAAAVEASDGSLRPPMSRRVSTRSARRAS